MGLFGSKLFASRLAPPPGPGVGQPATGVGHNLSTYPNDIEVTGPSSQMPATVWRAPVYTSMYGGPHGEDIAWRPGRFQSPPDTLSWRVHAPAVPSRYAGYEEIAYQIHRNGTSVEYITLKAPPIPIGGYSGALDPLGGAYGTQLNLPGAPMVPTQKPLP